MNIKNYKDFMDYFRNEDSNKREEDWIHKGDFKVEHDMIRKGEMLYHKIPDIVTGDFNCFNMDLTTLKNSPKEVRGDVYCSDNKLTNLKYFPEKVNGMIFCGGNLLTSLEFICKEIKKGLYGVEHLSIEKEFVLNGYKNYWPDLFQYCKDNGEIISDIKTWPDEFVKTLSIEDQQLIKSGKGINKFGL